MTACQAPIQGLEPGGFQASVPPTCSGPTDRVLFAVRVLWATMFVFALGELALVLSAYWISLAGLFVPLAAEPILPLEVWGASAALAIASLVAPRRSHARARARLMRQARAARELTVMSYRDAGPSVLRFRDPDAALGALAGRYAVRIFLSLAFVVPILVLSLGALDVRGWNGHCLCYGEPCTQPVVFPHPIEHAPLLGIALLLIGVHAPRRREMLGELAGCFAATERSLPDSLAASSAARFSSELPR